MRTGTTIKVLFPLKKSEENEKKKKNMRKHNGRALNINYSGDNDKSTEPKGV